MNPKKLNKVTLFENYHIADEKEVEKANDEDCTQFLGTGKIEFFIILDEDAIQS